MTNSKAIFLTASALALMTASSAWAQSAAPTAAVEEVVVTGSRLNNANFVAPTPVKVMSAADIAQRAPAVVGQLTNEIPGFKNTGPTQGTHSSGATVGQNSPDLRGLGAGRTLVLVDGHRHVGSGEGGVVDTNMVPATLVSRLEVVTGGASAAYGSDAVAGVVNIILNDKLNGLSGNVQYGESKYHDGKELSTSLGWGTGFDNDKGHIVLGADYSRNRGTGDYYSRPWGRLEQCQAAEPTTRPAGVPANVFLDNCELSTVTDGGIIVSGPLKGTAFKNDGTPYAFQYGTVLSSNMIGSTANYGNDLAARFQIESPLKRYATMALANYDVNDNLTLYAEGSYGHVDNTGGLATTTQINNYIIGVDNPFIPAATKAAMLAANLKTIQVGRFMDDVGRWLVAANTNTGRFVLGAKGKVFGDWTWDAYYQAGQSEEHWRIPNMTQTFNLLAAASVITGPDGKPACTPLASNPNLTTAAQRAGVQSPCVPFNVFGTQNSTAALGYVSGLTWSDTTIKQEVAGISLAGEPFMLPAGAVSVATGVEWRKDSVHKVTDPQSNATAPWSFNNPQSYDGSNTVKEGFLEVGVPLLKDLPLIKGLDLNAAVRRTDYQIEGPVTTWKAGLTWDISPDFRFRYTRSRDIRAPNLSELFSKATLSLGKPGVNPFNGQTSNIPQIGGGNPNLLPEVADTNTAGLVFTPTWSWLQGFRATVDYYKITIKGAVGSVDVQTTLNRCFQGIKQYCDAVTFDNTPFGVSLVHVYSLNLNQVVDDGIDVDVNYRVPLDKLPGNIPGRLDLRALQTWTDDLETTDSSGLSVDRAGAVTGGMPSIQGNYTATYSLGRFLGSIQARYINEMKFDVQYTGPNDPNYNPASGLSINKNVWPGEVYINLQAQYDLINEGSRKLQVFGVINNALDKDPAAFAGPGFDATGSTNPYDTIGRFYKLGLRFNY